MGIEPELTRDLAERALEADVRNALTNVAHGDTLAGGKRQLMLNAILNQATPEELLQARVSAILRKFTAGSRLRKEEMEEIAHLLPVEAAPYSKSTTEGGYQKSYREYEAIYGKKMRTIKWWVEQGKGHPKGPDLPPLDAPKEMPAWWGRVMKQKCPKPVTEAARLHATTQAPPPPQSTESPSRSTTPNRGASQPNRMRPEALEISSQEERLNQLKEQLAIARFQMLEAQAEDPADPAKIQSAQQHWRELREETDKAEEKLFKSRRDAGRLVDQDEVAAMLMPMLTTVATSVRTLIVRLKPRLRTAQSDAEEDAIWNSGVDECFTELIEAGFLERNNLTLN
jgi:hypothetical protein